MGEGGGGCGGQCCFCNSRLYVHLRAPSHLAWDTFYWGWTRHWVVYNPQLNISLTLRNFPFLACLTPHPWLHQTTSYHRPSVFRSSPTTFMSSLPAMNATDNYLHPSSFLQGFVMLEGGVIHPFEEVMNILGPEHIHTQNICLISRDLYSPGNIAFLDPIWWVLTMYFNALKYTSILFCLTYVLSS